MEQLPPPATSTPNPKPKNKRRLPSPKELVSYYEKQGMETQEASLKVIQDLQSALFRTINSKRSEKSGDTTSAKLDAVYSRLLQIETKVESKPSYPQALAIGVASAGIWSAGVELWGLVRRVTSSSSGS